MVLVRRALPTSLQADLVPFIDGIVILDTSGTKIVKKYFSPKLKLQNDQNELETAVYKKTKGAFSKSESDVILVNQYLVAYKSGAECNVYVLSKDLENDILLVSVLESFYDALLSICRGSIDKGSLFENLKYVLLLFDEMIDDGIILEMDSHTLVNRAKMLDAGDQPQTMSNNWMSFAETAGSYLYRAFAK